MSRGSWRQADMERLMRAAKKEGVAVTFDLRTFVATVLPIDDTMKSVANFPQGNFAPDGKENWDEE